MKTQITNSKDLLTERISEPLNNATTAKIDINSGTGNLKIDGMTSDEQLLISGTLQYFENQGLPTRTLDCRDGQAILTLRGGASKRPWFHVPWAACNGATEWQILLNSTVLCDITAHSDGGNIHLNLAGMAVTRVSADTGGGNIEIVLPDNAAGLHVTAITGAGNVVIHIPGELAAKIQATSGLGKVITDSRFSKIDKYIYQSPDYDFTDHKIEITAKTGAGNVSISTN